MNYDVEVMIFLKIEIVNIGFHKKKTDVNKVMLTLTSIFLKKLMLTYHLPTLVFSKIDVKEVMLTSTSVFFEKKTMLVNDKLTLIFFF